MTDWLGKIIVTVAGQDLTFILDLQGIWHCDHTEAERVLAVVQWLNAVHSPGTSRSPSRGYAGGRETREAAADFGHFGWGSNIRTELPPYPDDDPNQVY